MKNRRPLSEVFLSFLKYGLLGFGGPFALMASFQREFVEKRKWLSVDRFTQSLALVKCLPGPVATQMAIYLGYVGGGKRGGILSGTALIFPAFLMMVGAGYFYQSVSALGGFTRFFGGMQAAALGVIIYSLWKLADPFRKTPRFWIVAAIASALTFLVPRYEPLIIIGSGLIGAAWWGNPRLGLAALSLPFLLGASAITASEKTAKLLQLAWVSFKAGTFVFGTGLAIVPLLAADVVDHYQWLSSKEFLDALALGQITPGPVVITVTFIGFKVAGLLGATVATLAIFAPAFFNILVWFPFVERKLKKTPAMQRFLEFSVAAVIGGALIVTAKLVPGLIGGERTANALNLGLFAAAFLASLQGRIPVWAVIPLGGIVRFLSGV